jgi:acetate kinase
VRTLLTINAGSSSIKFALFEAGAAPRRLDKGSIERIGLADGPDRQTAVEQLMQWIGKHAGGDGGGQRSGHGDLGAVAHRIVHGGPRYSAPVRLTPAVVTELKALSPFDPDHLPQELRLAQALAERFPDLPQVACFDTAFHHDMPRVAQLLALPRRYQAQGLRRYGFHGLSYAYLMQELEREAGTPAAQGRVVLAHLGNGASLAAVRAGKSVDTSMGFTPAAGIPMSTRSGDLDPGIVWYLARTEGLDAQRFNQLVNAESGLLGLSETSPDMRDLLAREASDERAHDAVALFCYQVRKWIGAFAAALGGLDTLVFAGGIGEHAAPVRARVCEGLDFLGLAVDASRNAANARLISPDASRVAVRVIPTDEEQMMAQLVAGVLAA